jgi:hypothetical protein
MARRVAGTLIAAVTLLFVIVGFFGTANPGTLVPESSASRGQWPVFTVTGVTDAGRQAGLRVGDVLDYRLLTPLERYRFGLWDSGVIPATTDSTALGIVAANQSFTIPYLRDGKKIAIVQRTASAGLSDQIATVFTDVLSGFCALFAALLLVRGRDRASFLAGVFLAFLGTCGLPFVYGFNGFYTIASLSVPSEAWIGIVGQVCGLVALYLFAESLLPAQTRPLVRWLCRALYAPMVVFATASNAIAARFLALGDVDSMTLNYFMVPLYLVGLAVVLAMVWYASIDRHQTQRISVRIIFWSLLVGFSGVVFNAFCIGFLNGAWPLDGAFGLTLLAMPVGFAYVIFTRSLYDVDFFVSRAALYAILLGIVVAVIALTESFLDHVALGRFGNIALSFAIPIALGLSMRWIGGNVERFLQGTLYRDKTAAHERLRALASDFAEAHDPDVLARQVIVEIHRTFKCSCAVYRHDGTAYVPSVAEGFDHRLTVVAQDDPAFMRLRRSRATVDLRSFETALPRHGLLFPLIVVGRVYGAILVGVRPHDQWYDPDDQSVIRSVASELAAALLWLRDNSTPRAAYSLLQ